MNKRVIIVCLGILLLGILIECVSIFHYGWHWEPQSMGEVLLACSAGSCTGFGIAFISIEWIKGGEK